MRVSSILAAAFAAGVTAISTLSTKGSKFFDSNGAQFFIKGIAYQLSENDPLLDGAQCTRDANLMKTLGANAIRVYHVVNGNHDACMQAFADAGIYLFVDLDTFNTEIVQDNAHWNTTQRSAFEAVMDEFHQYDNTAGFFIGNEVVSDANHSTAAVYVKAAVRDLKSYRQSKGYREIPVGYSHADIAELRPQLQNYLACGDNDTARVDFFGLNSYEWCGQSSYSTSGYEGLNDQVKDYPVPIFMSETGCNNPQPRTFQDQGAIFGPQMSPYWSGAIIYEWIQETNAFGLITYGGATTAVAYNAGPTNVVRSGTPTPIVPDFANLKSAWATVSPSSVSANAYSPSLSNPPCPGYTPPSPSGGWAVNGNVALPQVGQTVSTSAVTAGLASPTASASSTHNAGTFNSPPSTGLGSGLLSVLLTVVYWL